MVWDRGDGDPGKLLRVGAVKGVEQAGRGFFQIAGGGEVVVAFDGAEADQPFVRRCRKRVEAERLAGRVVARKLTRRLNSPLPGREGLGVGRRPRT